MNNGGVVKTVATLICAATVGLAAVAEASQTKRTIPSAGLTRLEVSTTSGNISVIARPGSQVTVSTAHHHEIPLEINNGVLRISGRSTWHAGSMDLQIQIPSDVILSVDSVSGDVTVQGIRRRVHANTTSGDISTKDCTGPLTLETVSGDVEVFSAKSDLTVKTVSGDVNVIRLTTSRGRLSTHSGDISLAGKLSANGELEVESFSGDIEIALPSTAAFDLTAKSHSGRIDTDCPLVVWQHSRHSLRGRVGDGGAEIRITSFSGDIAIK